MAGFRRHTTEISRRKGRRFDPPWVGATPTVPSWSPSEGIQAEKRRFYRPMRGKILQVPVISAVTPTTVWKPDFTAERRNRLVRRYVSKFTFVPYTQLQISIPTERRRTITIKRSRVVMTPVPLQASVPTVAPRRKQTNFSKRGKLWNIIPIQAIVPVTVWPPSVLSRRQRQAFIRRVRKLEVPLVGAAVNAFVFFPKQIPRMRMAGILQRRGKRTDAPITQAVAPVAVWLPTLISARKRFLPARRLRRAETPVQQASVPIRMRSRVKFVAPRRARRFERLHMQAFVISTIKATRPRIVRVSRGHRFEIPVVRITIIPTAPFIRVSSYRKKLIVGKRRGRLFSPPWRKAVEEILRPGYDILRSANAPDGILNNALEIGTGFIRKVSEKTGILKSAKEPESELRDANEPDEGNLRKVD